MAPVNDLDDVEEEELSNVTSDLNKRKTNIQFTLHSGLSLVSQWGVLAVVYFSGQLKIDDYKNELRVAYITVHVLILSCMAYIKMQIDAKIKSGSSSEAEKVDVPEVKQMGQVVKPARRYIFLCLVVVL